MKGFFLIVDQAKNTLYMPADNSYFSDCLKYALKEYGKNVKEHSTFKDLDKTIHNYIKGAYDED